MSFPRYEAYKDSGVEWLGDVPEHWKVLKLKRIASFQSGDFITSESIEPDGFYPVFGGNGLRGYTSSYTHEGNFALIGRQGALCGNINYGTGHFWASEHAVVVSPHDEVITKWLGELLRSMNLNQYSVSAAQPGLAVERIVDLYVPYPSTSEQTQIAQFLDRQTAQIDALIAEQQRLIELLKEKRQVVISHAVTKGLDPTVTMKDSGVEWLGEVPEHWDIYLVKRNFNVELGKMLNSTKSMKGSIEKPYLRAANIHWNSVLLDSVHEMEFSEKQLSRYQLKSGDLLVTEGGVTVGRSAIWNGQLEECYYQNSINRVRPNCPNSASTYFLLYWMYLVKIIGYIDLAANMATFGHLTQEKLQNLFMPFPPIKEQTQIAHFLDDETYRVDTLVEEAEKSKLLLQERRSALISAAVTGKIDVRNWQPTANPQLEPTPMIAHGR